MTEFERGGHGQLGVMLLKRSIKMKTEHKLI